MFESIFTYNKLICNKDDANIFRYGFDWLLHVVMLNIWLNKNECFNNGSEAENNSIRI